MMTVQSIYDLGIKLGSAADPRGKTYVQQHLQREKRKYQELSDKEKRYYDTEYLTNPYSDTRILYTPKLNQPVKRLFAGIDCSEAELLLADRLGNIDLVISHHPDGIALADLHTVMDQQVEIMHMAGVPLHIAESLLSTRIGEIIRGLHPVNTQKPVDIARLLNIALMSTHTVTDNLVTTFIDNLMQKHRKDIFVVGDIIKILMEIPEYQRATELKFGPKIFIGSELRRPGKIAITEMTGGTNGPKEMFEQLSRAGVGTIIGMHMREDTRKEAEKYHINVIIAGHISSDSLGMNLFLDEIEKTGVEVIPVGGLIRVKRFKPLKKSR